ncbi:MAG: hypothetical protein CL885_03010 [Dehalococcoidia bacterium]|nr:hypothetical protein [Dehalococcoidia bacterium]
MSFLGAGINADQSNAGRSAVYVGNTVAGFNAMPTAMYSVGACDGTVSISPNQDVIKLQRSDGQNPYAVLETSYDFQVSFNMQEVDIFNLALACGYNVTDEAFVSTGDYGTSSGHHGVLHSNFSQFTNVETAGHPYIDEIVITAATPDTATITMSAGAAGILNGLDVDSEGTKDYVILSGITAAGATGLNGVVLSVETAPTGANPDVLVLDLGNDGVGDYGLTAGTYNASGTTGRLRRVYYPDAVSYTASSGDLVFDFVETEGFEEGDHLSLRGTQSLLSSTSLKFLQEINGYPLKITNVSSNTITVNIKELSTETGNQTAIGTDDTLQQIELGYVDLTRKLVLGSDSQSGYRSLMIRTEGGKNTSGARQVAEWQFYKAKLVYGGSVDYDRTGAVTYPVTAHCLGNSNDVVGQFITPSNFVRTSYYGES